MAETSRRAQRGVAHRSGVVHGRRGGLGPADRFARATEFLAATLERLGLPKERMFVVPGNHDVDRRLETDCWQAFRKAMASTPDLLGVTRWMSGAEAPPGFDGEWREQIGARLGAYRQWVSHELHRPELTGSATTLGYRVSLQISSTPLPVHILGLNTAWLCGDDNDAGRLWALDEQLMRIATDERGGPLPGLRLLLMHHPFDQLADGAACRRLLADHVDLVLRGHLHDEELETWSDPDRHVRQLAAGCLYEGWRADQWPNACHTITIQGDGTSDVEVRFRTWSARGGHWHDDNALYRGA